MKNNQIISVLLLTGILILANVLANRFSVRLDLTRNRQYTLSRATRTILQELEEPVTVTAYFSGNLPPEYAQVRRDFQDMLIEYANRSKGLINYKFISPESDDEQREAVQNGIQPLLINVSERDQVKQQQAFMGASLQLGEQKEVIPFVSPALPVEYALSSSIKKLAVPDKPSVGLVQGHGEPPLSQLGAVFEELSVLYNVENIDLADSAGIPDRFRAVALLAPTDSIPPAHLARLDDYLRRGGRLCVAINRVDGNLQTGQGTEVSTGLERWLAGHGLQVDPGFLIDEQCGAVTVQQRQGFFTIASQVQFPYLPLITTFADHPVTAGLEQVILPFASPLRYTGDSTLLYTPLAQSSARSGVEPAPAFFDVTNREWTLADFPQRNLTVAAALEGPIAGETSSTIVLFGDGDFPQAAQSPDNINLLVNAIDWLADDTGLIALRTKTVAARPIKAEFLGEGGEGQRALLKYLNFGLPIALVLLTGLLVFQRQQRRRRRLQDEHFT